MPYWSAAARRRFRCVGACQPASISRITFGRCPMLRSHRMSNPYGISEKVEAEIRARDKKCVYCSITMNQSIGPKRAFRVTPARVPR